MQRKFSPPAEWLNGVTLSDTQFLTWVAANEIANRRPAPDFWGRFGFFIHAVDDFGLGLADDWPTLERHQADFPDGDSFVSVLSGLDYPRPLLSGFAVSILLSLQAEIMAMLAERDEPTGLFVCRRMALIEKLKRAA